MQAAFTSFTASLKPFSTEVSKSFVQASQFAKERFSNADATELPAEYRLLEDKVERIKLVHELLLKIGANYITSAYDYEAPVVDKLTDFVSSVGGNAATLASRYSGQTMGSTITHQEIPPSLSHAFAKAAFQSVDLLENAEPLSLALKKFATTEERMGNFRIQQDQDANSKFYAPLLKTLNTKIADSMKSKKLVQSCRLTYDSCRARLKIASPSKAEIVRQEMLTAEDEFVAAVDVAMGNPWPYYRKTKACCGKWRYAEMSLGSSRDSVAIPQKCF